MLEWISQLNNFSSNVLLLIGVILIKILLARFITPEPLDFFCWYCQQLAKKVNKQKNSSQQQYIAGVVANVITITPLIIILWLFKMFIVVPFLWNGILLFLALGNFKLSVTINNIEQALLVNQTHLAKQYLDPLVLRDVKKLSSMGIAKATIEMNLLHYLQQYFMVGWYFLTLDPLMALISRLIIEMHHSWNIKLPTNHFFGKFSAYLAALIQWLPNRIFTLLLLISALGNHFVLLLSAFKKYFFKLNNNIVIDMLAVDLDIKLAGVAIYNKQKLRRISFNNIARQPHLKDIIRSNKIIQNLSYFSLALTIPLVILTTALH